MINVNVAQHRKEIGDKVAKFSYGKGRCLAAAIRARSEVEGHTASANGDAIVRGSLSVHEGVGTVAQGFATIPSDREGERETRKEARLSNFAGARKPRLR